MDGHAVQAERQECRADLAFLYKCCLAANFGLR